jgi:hypothetical protein
VNAQIKEDSNLGGRPQGEEGIIGVRSASCAERGRAEGNGWMEGKMWVKRRRKENESSNLFFGSMPEIIG